MACKVFGGQDENLDIPFKKIHSQLGWREGSEIKSSGWSSQHVHGSSQLAGEFQGI